MKLIDAGETNASFFYNVNILSYYVYSNYFKSIKEALKQYKKLEGKPNHEKMYVVKIEHN